MFVYVFCLFVGFCMFTWSFVYFLCVCWWVASALRKSSTSIPGGNSVDGLSPAPSFSWLLRFFEVTFLNGCICFRCTILFWFFSVSVTVLLHPRWISIDLIYSLIHPKHTHTLIISVFLLNILFYVQLPHAFSQHTFIGIYNLFRILLIPYICCHHQFNIFKYNLNSLYMIVYLFMCVVCLLFLCMFACSFVYFVCVCWWVASARRKSSTSIPGGN